MKEKSKPDDARGMNWTIVALLAGAVLLIGIVAYFATDRNIDQDKLTNAEIARSTPPASQEKKCASGATFDLIKRELFRQAAQLRGHDQATYDSLASFAVLRVENAVMEGQDAGAGLAHCSGSVSIELPPGVTLEDGRRTLMADLEYTADANGNVTLANAAALVGRLAKLVRTAPPAAAAAPDEANVVATENEAEPVPPQPTSPPEPEASPLRPR